ncbi:MAG: hypothetical protein JSV45_04030 [Chromatiales bacterium]|nr:MAG: hypothetical protein JSV45_04030 [Chromatiales bacterium]
MLAGLVCLGLSGCFFKKSPEEKCAKPEEYQASDTIGELRVPPGFDKPDQGESMEIPEAGQQGYPEGRPCLEMPPDYFGRPVD